MYTSALPRHAAVMRGVPVAANGKENQQFQGNPRRILAEEFSHREQRVRPSHAKQTQQISQLHDPFSGAPKRTRLRYDPRDS